MQKLRSGISFCFLVISDKWPFGIEIGRELVKNVDLSDVLLVILWLELKKLTISSSLSM